MRFVPPFCPLERCLFNRTAPRGFASPHGFYYSRARGRVIARFRCSACRATFSYATFRFSYRQKKPHLDAMVMRVLCSGVSLRGTARLLGINRKTVFRKLRRVSAHSSSLHRVALASGKLVGVFQLDELESFESNRFQPVTVPVLIEKRTHFVVATDTAPLRRKGRMTLRQKQMRTRHEAAYGRRPSDSDTAVKRCLAQLASAAGGHVVLESDRKPSYGRIAKELFGRGVSLQTHDSRRRRDRSNPLFAINHTNAMLRYCLARLRRRTWCVSRLRAWLQHALNMYAAWFNYCRGITNRTKVSPAEALGLAQERMRESEWLSWRQDWHNAGRILPAPLRMATS